MSIGLQETDQQPVAIPRRLAAGVASFTMLATMAAAIALAVLIFTTDPGLREKQIFAGLILVLTAGLSSTAILLFGRRSDSALADALRALRRGLLLGMACSGAFVLQLNASFTPPNVGFLLLVLLIVEMIFLARRQHPA